MGLQDKKWDEYFDETQDSIIGGWSRCDVCKRIPSQLYCDVIGLMSFNHCHSCKKEDFKPKSYWERINVWLENRLQTKTGE